MSYLKRQKMPKSWPIPRKGTTYVVTPDSGLEKGLPLLIILRDILKVAKNRNEAKKAVKSRSILLNGKEVLEEKSLICLFDSISIPSLKKHYKLILSEKSKFMLQEIGENEALKKVYKVIDRKMIKGKKMQINLMDGRNVLSEIKVKVNDSVLFSFKENKIEKIIPFKENAKVIIFAGKHSGEKGIVNTINHEKKLAEVNLGGKETKVLIKQLIVVE